ncbi:ABC transporter permease [Acidisoma cladoniae]|jgi:peptide/nickel transport system permease protein|uniref:ABC transporter permease n=1 Tax=Acidisoma cladoniae TaxID=3040935 RepID=UPI00254E7C56|nr:ABC transporter permease [Acidisoma sp. PAMC 29798]
MLSYVIQRISWAFVIMMATLIMLFSLVYVIPGDPASVALGPRATPEMRQELRARMGLDKPVPVQIARFVGNALQGDLGEDLWSHRPVSTMVVEALPYTLELSGFGIGWAILLGIPLGCWSALRRGGWVDRIVGIGSAVVISLPSFVIAIYGLLLFAVRLHWLPALGAGPEGDIGQNLLHLVMPSFAIGLGWVGYLARLVRASMIEVLGENHVRMLRAFGVGERRIALRFALPIAIVPTLTVLGVGVGSLLSGAVLVEIIFNRPGLGKLTYDAVISRNFPVVMGTVLVTTALYVLCTVIADLLVAWLDPRVRASL